MNLTKGVVVALLVFLATFGIFKVAFRDRIESDEIGVWRTNGGMDGISNYELRKGYFPADLTPLTKGFKVPGKPWVTEKLTYDFESIDRTTWKVEIDFNLQAIPSHGVQIAFSHSSNLSQLDPDEFLTFISEREISPIIKEWLKTKVQTSRDTFLEANRNQLSNKLEEYVEDEAAKLGWNISKFSIELKLPAALKSIANAKAEAIASSTTAQARIAEVEAKTSVEIAQAKSDAEIKLIRARAEADANRILTQSMTPELVKLRFIEKWKGDAFHNGVRILDDLK